MPDGSNDWFQLNRGREVRFRFSQTARMSGSSQLVRDKGLNLAKDALVKCGRLLRSKHRRQSNVTALLHQSYKECRAMVLPPGARTIGLHPENAIVRGTPFESTTSRANRWSSVSSGSSANLFSAKAVALRASMSMRVITATMASL